MATEQRTSPEMRADLWRRHEASLLDIEEIWPWTHAQTIAAPVLLADADALAGALAEVARLRTALATIQQWDCLNPPNIGLCEDFPWLRELVDTALGTGGATDGNG